MDVIKGIDAYSSAGFVNYGACYLAKNQLEQAKASFQNAVDLDPACFQALYNLGLFFKTFKLWLNPNLFRSSFEAAREL